MSGTQLSRNVPPASLDWHPTRKILAIGWDNGEVVVWNEHEKELFNVAPIHKADISLVHWTSLGTRLLTADSVSYNVLTDDKSYILLVEVILSGS